MRKIKFRGIDIKTGEYVYGDFLHRGPFEGKPGIIDDEDFYHEINPKSLAQLVGYDEKNGEEVYEGDTVKRIKYWEDDDVLDFHGYVDCEGKIFQASFSDFDAILNGEIVKVEG